MNRKTVVFAISIFLSILFLSTVGGYLTGFILLAKEPTLANFPYPFIKGITLNNAIIVTSDTPSITEQTAAITLSRSLKINGVMPKVVTVSTLPEGIHNLILIGTPCNNKLIAEKLNTNKCSLTKKGEGLIKLVNEGDVSYSLILSGDVAKASKVLQNKGYYPLRGTNIIISGTKSLMLRYNANVLEKSNLKQAI